MVEKKSLLLVRFLLVSLLHGAVLIGILAAFQSLCYPLILCIIALSLSCGGILGFYMLWILKQISLGYNEVPFKTYLQYRSSEEFPRRPRVRRNSRAMWKAILFPYEMGDFVEKIKNSFFQWYGQSLSGLQGIEVETQTDAAILDSVSISRLSHEFNTSLNAILGATQVVFLFFSFFSRY